MKVSNYNSPNFYANLNSKKLRFKQDDFFVKIRGYGQNRQWANEIIKVADTAVNLIRKDTSAENVLKIIAVGIKNANKLTLDIVKKLYSGVLRVERDGWASHRICDLTTPYSNNKYKSYEKRLDYIAEHPLKNSSQMDFSRPHIYDKNSKVILHASSLYVNKILNRVFELAKEVFPKYVHEDVKPENMDKINSTVAEIRWLLAHSTPWLRGSDAISNVFIRAIYKSVGIKSYPLKKGMSLDLEAYCTELKEYKKNFTGYFVKPPEIIE